MHRESLIKKGNLCDGIIYIQQQLRKDQETEERADFPKKEAGTAGQVLIFVWTRSPFRTFHGGSSKLLTIQQYSFRFTLPFSRQNIFSSFQILA